VRAFRFVIAAAACATVAVVIGTASPAWAATGGFGAAPAHPNPDDPATRAYFKPVLAPGTTYTDDVLVTSSSSGPLNLLVSPVDGLTGQTSGAVYANRDVPVRKAGAWVTPAISALSLAPGAQTLVPFTVAVPANATPGDHLAGIAVEDANPQSASGQFAVTEVFRTVVGVDIVVPGPAQSDLHLSGLGLRALPGAGVASLTIHIGDHGRKLVKPLVAVSLRGPGGYRRTIDRQLDTILPGDTIAYPFLWPDSLRAGTYHAVVRGTGGPSPVSVSATLQLGQPLRGVTNPTLPSQGFKVLSPLGIALLLLLLLLVIGAVTLVVRRRRRAAPDDDVEIVLGPSSAPTRPRASNRRGARRSATRRKTRARDARHLDPISWTSGPSSR